MYAFTPSTLLPSHTLLTLPQTHLTLLSTFFQTVDDAVSGSPNQAANFTQIFTPDGVWKTPRAKFEGHEELIESGHRFDPDKELKSMLHWVTEVYIHDAEGTKLMLMGLVKTEGSDGELKAYPFSARVEIDLGGGGEGEVKLKFFQGWSSGF